MFDLRTEIANQVCSQGSWGPLPVYNISIGLNVETELLVTLSVVLAILYIQWFIVY